MNGSTPLPEQQAQEAEIVGLMNSIGALCDGKHSGMVVAALMNCVHRAAAGGDTEMRKAILVTLPELVANIEAMDARVH